MPASGYRCKQNGINSGKHLHKEWTNAAKN